MKQTNNGSTRNSFLFYSGDTDYQMKPAEEWRETVQITVG
jgi:hypothetical protein